MIYGQIRAAPEQEPTAFNGEKQSSTIGSKGSRWPLFQPRTKTRIQDTIRFRVQSDVIHTGFYGTVWLQQTTW